MIIKMALNWTHRRPFCTLTPDADLCMRLDLPLDKKTVENQDWATGPPGLQGHRGPRAAGRGPPGRGGPRAADRRAVAGRGPRAAGPLGRGPAFSKTRKPSSAKR